MATLEEAIAECKEELADRTCRDSLSIGALEAKEIEGFIREAFSIGLHDGLRSLIDCFEFDEKRKSAAKRVIRRMLLSAHNDILNDVYSLVKDDE